MNAEKFTRKALEAVQDAQRLATENGNQRLEQAHLLQALLSAEDGLIPKLLSRMGVSAPALLSETVKKTDAMPKVSGGNGQLYLSNELSKALDEAEKQMSAMKDSYISVEHLFLGLLEQPDKTVKELFRQFNVQKNAFLQALKDVRGNAQVNSDNPEDTYDVLNKYGTDLVERARQHKLDPVIGRDEEIRNVIRILSRKTKNNPVLIGEAGVGLSLIHI